MKENVVLIVADAMRADRLSQNGYKRKGKAITPNLDKLAEEGELYPKAYSPGPWTAASQPALLTGIYSSKMGYPSKGTELNSEFKTIGEHFKNLGYATRAYNMSMHIRGSLGFSEGFDYYEDIALKDHIEPDFWHLEGMAWNLIFGQDNRTRYALKKIKRWLKSREKDQPFFLFWNPTNPHNKYRAPKKFRKTFEKDISPDMDREVIEEVAGWGHCRDYITGEIDLTEEEMDVVESRYDAEIAYLDYRIGQLIDNLKQRGIYEDTTIIFTSDHGENFGEYNRLLYHSFSLNEGLIQVPLIIKGDGFKETERPVSTIDILNSVHKKISGTKIQGVDSKPYLLQSETEREVVLSERGSIDHEFTTLKNSQEELPKDYNWLKSGKKAGIIQDKKLLIDSRKKEEEFEIIDNKQKPSEIDEKIKDQIRSEITENLGPYDRDSKEVDKKIKDKLEKLGYT